MIPSYYLKLFWCSLLKAYEICWKQQEKNDLKKLDDNILSKSKL